MSTDDEIRTAAQKYVNDQMAIMEKYGHAAKITAQQYGELVQEVIALTHKLRNRAGVRSKELKDGFYQAQ